MNDDEIKTLFDAAAVLGKCIKRWKRWMFTGSLESISDHSSDGS